MRLSKKLQESIEAQNESMSDSQKSISDFLDHIADAKKFRDKLYEKLDKIEYSFNRSGKYWKNSKDYNELKSKMNEIKKIRESDKEINKYLMKLLDIAAGIGEEYGLEE